MPASRLELYGILFFHLQNCPTHLLSICEVLNISQLNLLVQIVMFSLYGNQYDPREENLLLNLLKSLISRQFDSAFDYCGLLRANTPATRLLTTYNLRGPGIAYLKKLLSARIQSIAEIDNINLELSPLKIYYEILEYNENSSKKNSSKAIVNPFISCPLIKACVSANLPIGNLLDDVKINENCNSVNLPICKTDAEAAVLPCVKLILERRVSFFMNLGDCVVDDIISSITMVPFGIRWICKSILKLTRSRFPETPNSMALSIVSSYFLLRFINPAIVTPHSYQLISEPAKSCSRRILTMLAKMIQMLGTATPGTTTAQSITMLIPFQKWAQNKISKMSKFITELCDVDDFELSTHPEAISLSTIRFYATLSSNSSSSSIIAEKEDEKLLVEGNLNLNKFIVPLSSPSKINFHFKKEDLEFSEPLLSSMYLQTKYKSISETCDMKESFQINFNAKSTNRNNFNMRVATSPNELFLAHALLLKHKNILSPDIRAILDLLEEPPELLPRERNNQINLKLISPNQISTATRKLLGCIKSEDFRLSENNNKDHEYFGNSFKENNNLKNECDSEEVDRVVPNESGGIEISYSLDLARKYADAISEEDKKEERESILSELLTLESSYNNIQSRQIYLQEQLASYTSYLNNVKRLPSSCVEEPVSPSNNNNSNSKKPQMKISIKNNKQEKNIESPTMPPSINISPACFVKTMPSKLFSYVKLIQTGMVSLSRIPKKNISDFSLLVSCISSDYFLITARFSKTGFSSVEIQISLQELQDRVLDNIYSIDLKYIVLNGHILLELLKAMSIESMQ